MDTKFEGAYRGFAIVELMGHRRIGGLVCQAEQFGVAMLRVDIPGEDGETAATQFYGGASIYALTPCSADAARAVARNNQPEPVTHWELPRLAAGPDEFWHVACLECGDRVTVASNVGSAFRLDCGQSYAKEHGETPDAGPAAAEIAF